MGAEGIAGGGGSVALGSGGRIGSGASTCIALGVTCFFFRSSMVSTIASLMEIRAIPLVLSTHPALVSFSADSLLNLSLVSIR
jgi:hypothetical protein